MVDVFFMKLTENKSSLVWSTPKELSKTLLSLPEGDFVTALNLALTQPMVELETFLYEVSFNPFFSHGFRSNFLFSLSS